MWYKQAELNKIQLKKQNVTNKKMNKRILKIKMLK